MTRKRSPQKFVVGATVALAIIVLGAIGVIVVREYLIIEIASSLVLRDKPADSAYWKLTETRRGYLIQATRGRYRGWYLDVDGSLPPVLFGEGLETGETDRFIVLSRKARSSAYWNLIEVGNGNQLLQSAQGTTKDEYVDIAALDTPDRGDGFLFARNLLISPGVQFPWSVNETEKGTTIQATQLSYTNWYLAVDDSVAPNETVTVKSDPTLRVDMEVRARIKAYERAFRLQAAAGSVAH